MGEEKIALLDVQETLEKRGREALVMPANWHFKGSFILMVLFHVI